jgi:hypothetical protein
LSQRADSDEDFNLFDGAIVNQVAVQALLSHESGTHLAVIGAGEFDNRSAQFREGMNHAT